MPSRRSVKEIEREVVDLPGTDLQETQQARWKRAADTQTVRLDALRMCLCGGAGRIDFIESSQSIVIKTAEARLFEYNMVQGWTKV